MDVLLSSRQSIDFSILVGDEFKQGILRYTQAASTISLCSVQVALVMDILALTRNVAVVRKELQYETQA